MLRKAFLGLILGSVFGAAHAQTAPSPADVGISKGTPDVFRLKGHDNTWTPFGSVDPSTHVFVPGTNGTIAPNDCLKWGPGLTSAGAACNSVTGGAHPANQLTIYTSHAGLVANVTTPTEAWTVQQQGFYAPGDGGDATYQWSLTSYCPGGTSGTPVTADGVVCVLPIGQSASTAGRYLLSVTGDLDPRAVGMQPGGQDNSPYLPALLLASGPPNGSGATPQSGGNAVRFAGVSGQAHTEYYFSQSFSWSRRASVYCGGGPAYLNTVSLVFAPGADGVVQEVGATSLDGGAAYGTSISGCNIQSLGFGFANMADASNAVTSLITEAIGSLPATTWGVGDGIIAMPYGYAGDVGVLMAQQGTFFSVPYGTTITAVSGSTLTMNNPATILTPPSDLRQMFVYRLPATLAYHVNTTVGSNVVTMTGGPPIKVFPGDFIWSDAFPFGSVVAHSSGAAGAQTFDIHDYGYSSIVNASVTHTGGSGRLWVIPAGIKRRVTGQTHNNTLQWWPIGLEMSGGSGTTPQTGGTTNWDANNTIGGNGIGRLVTGDNVGASTSYANLYGNNHIADIVELGSVGSVYLGDNANSQEDSTSVWSIFGTCAIGGSSFIGMYFTFTNNTPYCMDGSAIVPPQQPMSPGRGPLFIDAIDGYPPDVNAIGAGGSYGANWTFTGPQTYPVTATTPTPSGSIISIPTPNWVSKALGVTDVQARINGTVSNAGDTGAGNILTVSKVVSGSIIVGQYLADSHLPVGLQIVSGSGTSWIVSGTAYADHIPITLGAIPPGTTVTKADLSANQITLSNPVAGPGIISGQKVSYVPNGTPVPCVRAAGGLSGQAGLYFDNQCGSSGAAVLFNYWGGNINTWAWSSEELVAPLLEIIDNTYTGYKLYPTIGLPTGAEISNVQEGVGNERMLDMGSAVPAATNRMRGDIRLNSRPTPGGNMAWTDVPSFSTTLTAPLAVSATTASVAACPPATVPAGVPIDDIATIPSKLLGTFTSCTGTTLTLSAASAAGASGDTIQFMEWRQAARIANDQYGLSWPAANPIDVGNLLASAPCNANNVGFGVVTNGVAVGTGGYGTAVSATGSSTRPVFCDGTSWTYH